MILAEEMVSISPNGSFVHPRLLDFTVGQRVTGIITMARANSRVMNLIPADIGSRIFTR
jgi:hypothetical protein